jgi:hypothetical protein
MATQLAQKDIKYFGRDFNSLKQGLIDFTRTYYPNTYNDFNEASPGMMFLEMAAYVGDVLNYYIDSQFKESLLTYATERRSLLAMAAAMGYKPKISVPATVTLDLFQLLPAKNSGINAEPDFSYALKFNAGTRVRSTANGTEFLIQDVVDFSLNDVYSPIEVSVYSIDSTGAPNYYLAKKSTKAISATPVTTTYTFGSPVKFDKVLVESANLIGIDSIVDSDGNEWTEVPYLAQDTVFNRVQNTSFNDPDAAVYSAETPYLLKLKRVPRRFITRVVERGIEIQFGAGISSSPDEELLATPENIGLLLPTGKPDIDFSIDPASPVFTNAYGIAPANTVLTVTYLVGGGVAANVPSNTINEIVGGSLSFATLQNTNTTLAATIINSAAVNNPEAAAGGRSGETLEEIRQNTLMQVATQNRAVTREDYILRAYAMPNVYGSVAKVYIAPDEQNNIGTSEINDTVANPLALNMYMLGYTSNGTLTTVNRAIKENLKNYLSEYRMLTDSINLRDAFIINIGVEFDIIPIPNYNANEVLLLCIDRMKNYFATERWEISQPIYYSDIYNELIGVRGVQTVTNIVIKNLNDTANGYSNIFYDVNGATFNGIVYPSLDPAIFEVKYPNSDIKGRIVTY